jgi:hypothetical protein
LTTVSILALGEVASDLISDNGNYASMDPFLRLSFDFFAICESDNCSLTTAVFRDTVSEVTSFATNAFFPEILLAFLLLGNADSLTLISSNADSLTYNL